MAKKKSKKLREFYQERLAKQLDLSPTVVKQEYEKQYPNAEVKDIHAYIMAGKRLGLTAEKRENIIVEQRKQAAEKDIFDYAEVKSYLNNAKLGGVLEKTINKKLKALRQLWELMGKTDPHTWTSEGMLTAIATVNPWTTDSRGRSSFTHPAKTLELLSPYSTMFNSMGVLQKNWSANLCVHKAGELKDFLNFPEMDEFLSKLTDTELMSIEGWRAAFKTHVNMGSREGTLGNTGLMGLLWEDINFQTKRCSLREKGHRGNAGERWNDVPLNMFKWLHGWEDLMKFWEQQGKPAKGKVFPIKYADYNEMFHATRKKCSCRIKDDDDAMLLHTFGRRTHAQYAQRLGIPLERICGKAPNGRFGVGWKDPKIPVNYYLSEEAEEIDPAELQFMQTHTEYSQVLKSMLEQNQKIKELLGEF